MGFQFTYLCDLLSNLENNRVVKASTASKNSNPDVRAVARWFSHHGKRLHASDADQVALLSCMFPDKRTDRVYWLQDTSLARVIGRCLLLGSSRLEELQRWRVSGGIDLGQCVENVMRQAENHIVPGQEVTVEEIDVALNRIASRCKFSGPQVRRQRTAVDVEEALAPLYLRLSSRDAKWLTRMILKSYYPVILPTNFTLKNFHFLLPHLLLFQDTFDSALKILASEPISHFPPHPEPGLAKDLGVIALQHLKPEIGIKIGRPDYYKARSITHCCQMIGGRRMSMERKYDGEYCQIHIDLTKRFNSIQIFSKSGKDSTADRSGIHDALRQSLRIGQPDCKFSRRCILEGELLVWSDKHAKIMDFHKLRKFVSRSGTFIGIDNDSPPQPYEHLMIVFFDLLLLDDDVCLRKPHRERRLLLKDVVKVAEGHAELAEQQILDFSHSGSQSRLEWIFAKGVSERWEGFVLKGCEDPYFPIFSNPGEDSFGRWIKLKKDYIPGLGDTVDLAIIGGRYDSRDANANALRQIKKLLWTQFFIGCLANKEAVLKFQATPRFKVVDVINRHCMSAKNMQILNQFGEYSACNLQSGHGFDIEHEQASMPSMDVVYKTPFVVEMLGSGFEKPSGARYYALRFPRILKVHWDRSFEDAASFQELQLLAEDAQSVPAEDLMQEEEEWNKRLKVGTGASQYVVNRSQNSSTSSHPTSTASLIKGCELSSVATATASCNGTDGQHSSKNSANIIPIYADETAVSVPSADEACSHGHFLASNDNLSSAQKTSARKVPEQAATSYLKDRHVETGEESENIDQSNALDPQHISISSSSPTRKRKSLSGNAVANVRVPVISTPSNKPQQSIKSPLITIPLYLIQAEHTKALTTSTCAPTNQSNFSSDIDNFLQTLGSHDQNLHLRPFDPQGASQNISLGMVLIDCTRCSLGTILLDLSNRITERLQSKTVSYPCKGRIFILDSKLLGLGTGLDDPRFCLRMTWENIGKEYFYACIAWSSEIAEGTARNKMDEIPLTPRDDESGARGLVQNCTGAVRRAAASRIDIGFDRQQLSLLGEFTSIEPLVHVSSRASQ